MLRFGYFDSDIIGTDDEGMPIFDRAELSDLFAILLASLVSDGVLALPNTCFKIIAGGNGLGIERMPGFGMVKGHLCYDNESDTMMLTAPQTYSRIDRVIMRLNLLDRMVEIIIKQGDEAEKPKPPELIRPSAGDFFELCLAEITLMPKQTTITQSSIKDTRANSALCGFITQLIDHLDTDVFFDQLNAFYQEFVDKSNTSYEQFVDMAQKAYDSFFNMMDSCYAELSQKGEELYEQYNTEISDYIRDLKEKGNTDLAVITKQLINFRNENESEFLAWVERMKSILGEGTAGELLIKTGELTDQIGEMEQMLLSGSVLARLLTDDGKYITDDMGNALLMDRPICKCK